MTTITREELDKLYNERGLTIRQIAAQLGVCDKTVQSWMEKHNLPRRDQHEAQRRYFFSREMLDDLYNQQDLSTYQIARQLNVAHTTVQWWMEKYDLPRRKKNESARISHISFRHRIYTLNEIAFNPPLTDEQAYWLGFLMADGCVRDDNSITIAVQAADYAHLEQFRAFLGSNHPIYQQQRGTYHSARLTVASAQLAAALKHYGVIPRKSFVASASPVLEPNPHFWRGMIDGDGFLSWSSKGKAPIIGLCGSQAIVSQFAAFCYQVSDTRSNIHTMKNIYEFKVSGLNALPIIAALYGVPGSALPRK
ncbi:hypothetical protein TFLX_01027 [Thermoflexales bacterium]|nr:hypothetical protein TFLX_01027 [Thermoflexales bacterium]